MIRRFPAQSAARIQRMLDRLDSATKPEDMNMPGWRWHPLKATAPEHTRSRSPAICASRSGSTAAMRLTLTWRITTDEDAARPEAAPDASRRRVA